MATHPTTMLRLLWIALEVAAAFLYPALPLLVAACSLLTPLRHSRRTQVLLWSVALVASIVVLLPAIVAWTGLSWTTVETHSVRPG